MVGIGTPQRLLHSQLLDRRGRHTRHWGPTGAWLHWQSGGPARGGRPRRNYQHAGRARPQRNAASSTTPTKPHCVKDGWKHTGDTLVHDVDGYFFYYPSRGDDMIITSGYDVAVPAAESTRLLRPALAECAVITDPDPTTWRGDRSVSGAEHVGASPPKP